MYQILTIQQSTDKAKFSMKFTKGNTIVAPAKLYYLQKKYARRYSDENGKEFEFMVDRVFMAVNDYSKKG